MTAGQVPPVSPVSPTKPVWQVLPLSARTPAELEQAAADVAARLRASAGAGLEEVARALQAGPPALEHRRALVCDGPEEALRLLGGGAGRSWSAAHPAEARGVAFVFPGVGEQYQGMARELYEGAPVFRAALDRSFRLLDEELRRDLRPLLFPPRPASAAPKATRGPSVDLRAMLGRGAPPRPPDPLKSTMLAQPVIFAIEQALAEQLLSWGLRPSAVLGYSVGEYVAACVAGVFSPEDALRLVARRALAIDRLPQGAMLAVALPAPDVRPRLVKDTWVASINNPQNTVAAGTPEGIAELEKQLTAAGVSCRRIEASHAFHTPLLAPVGAELTALAAATPRAAPRLPFISNLTGQALTAEQALDPGYWARHMCETLQFEASVATLFARDESAILEVGPGLSLSSSIKLHLDCTPERRARILQSLPGPHDREPADVALLTAIARLWLAGVSIRWDVLRQPPPNEASSSEGRKEIG